MIKSRFAAAAAAVALIGALSGCGGDSPGEDPASTPSSAESASEESAEQSCSGLTAQEAVDEWISEIPPDRSEDRPRHWDWETDLHGDSRGYDECAALSWIDIGIVSPTGSSPKHVMLFHNGEFVMTATVDPEGFIPSIERKADDEVGITFGYLKPGEITADASGEAASTYTWDEEQETVVRSGELPDGSESEAQRTDHSGSGEAASCAGGFELPDDVDESVCGEPADGARELTAGRYGAALIFTPSENIWCSFTEDELDCSMIDPMTRIDLGTSGEAYAPDRGDGPVAEEPTTVGYGQTVTFGPFACHSQEIGLSCWNTDTRHGLFLSREESHMW